MIRAQINWVISSKDFSPPADVGNGGIIFHDFLDYIPRVDEYITLSEPPEAMDQRVEIKFPAVFRVIEVNYDLIQRTVDIAVIHAYSYGE